MKSTAEEQVLRPGFVQRVWLGFGGVGAGFLMSALMEPAAGLLVAAWGGAPLVAGLRYQMVVTADAVTVRRVWDTVRLSRSRIVSVGTVQVMPGWGVVPSLDLVDGTRVRVYMALCLDQAGARVQANRIADALGIASPDGFWGSIR